MKIKSREKMSFEEKKTLLINYLDYVEDYSTEREFKKFVAELREILDIKEDK